MHIKTDWPDRQLFDLWVSILMFGLIFFAADHTKAQQPPILNTESVPSGQTITDSVAIFHTEKTLMPGQAWKELLEQGKTNFRDFGYTDHQYWAGVQLNNLSSSERWIIEIENPHIDFITLFARSQATKEWVEVERLGDSIPFYNRTIAHFNPALPVDFSNETPLNILILLHKRHSSLNFNLRLWEFSDFNRHQQGQYALYGGYFGILLLVFTAVTLTLLFLRKKVYLWYLLYLLTIGFYILADTGLAHQFIYPYSDAIPNYARMILTYGFLFTFIPFTQHYFSTSATHPNHHKIFNILLVITALHFVIFTSWFLLAEVDGILALASKSIIILLCQLFLLYHGLVQLRIKKIQAIFYLAAFSAMLLSGIYKIVAQFGLVPRIVYPMPPLQAGFFIEILILTAGLGWQIRQIEFDRIKFRSRINKLKNEKLRAYVDGVEEERSRIAMDLHDSVGSSMAHLIRLIETNVQNQKKQLLDLSKKNFSEVRRISHRLAPPGLAYSNLEQNLQQLVDDINENSAICYRLQTLDLPEELSEKHATQIYRLAQEAINNIERHSQAKEANIQLIRHDDQLVLTIEDDGTGLPENHFGKGIGLQHLQMRTEQLGGTLEISSIKNRGVHILAIIPTASEY